MRGRHHDAVFRSQLLARLLRKWNRRTHDGTLCGATPRRTRAQKMNTTEFLTISAAIVPDRLAIIFENERITYEDLQGRANRLANSLDSLGVGPGDRVAILQVNCNQYVEAYFATAKLDAVYVPLNFRARAEELAYMVNDAQPRVLLVGGRYTDPVRSISDRLSTVQHYVALDEPVDGWSRYDDLLASGSGDERFPEADGDDLTIVIFTAGTTAAPKGVMLSHDSFSSYVLSNVSPADLDLAERNILTVPLYHIAGVQAVMAAIYGGRTLIVQRQFEAKEPRPDGANDAQDAHGAPGFWCARPEQSERHNLWGRAHASRRHQARHRQVPSSALHQRLRTDRNGGDHHHAPAGRPCARWHS